MIAVGLPEVIAKVTIPEKKGDERPYEKFRGLVLESIKNYRNYTMTKGAYYDEQGALIQQETGHIEHIHHYDTEKEKTEQLLASIRVEDRFGEKYYVMEIYDRNFADQVEQLWGRVEFLPKKSAEEPHYAKR